MNNDVDTLKEGLITEIAYHFEEIDKLENGSEGQKVMVADTKALIDAYNNLCQTENEAKDKEERRKMDKEKNKNMAELESKKAKLSWDRVIFELVKVFGPAGLTIWSYDRIHKRTLKFEETGRISSDAGRSFMKFPSLPRLFK